jgi:hypothetical protein
VRFVKAAAPPRACDVDFVASFCVICCGFAAVNLAVD